MLALLRLALLAALTTALDALDLALHIDPARSGIGLLNLLAEALQLLARQAREFLLSLRLADRLDRIFNLAVYNFVGVITNLVVVVVTVFFLIKNKKSA